MDCLHCGKRISVLRKLKNEEFCSAAHRKAYLKKQEDLAIDFLLQSKPHSRAKPQVAEPPGPPPPAPVEPKPILVLAGFIPESVAAGSLVPAPLRNAEPVPYPLLAGLPARTGVTIARVRASGFARMTFELTTAAGSTESALARAVAFESQSPRLQRAVAGPLWIEPASQASPERRRAAFAAYQPAWIRAGREVAHSTASARFSFEMSVIPVDLAAAGPAFRLAGFRRPSPAIDRTPASLRAPNRNTWVLRPKTTNMPSGGVAARPPIFPPCEPLRPVLLPAAPTPGSSAALEALHPLTSQQSPQTQSGTLEMTTPSLRSAPKAVMEAPRPVPDASHKASRPRSLVWKFQSHMGWYTRLNMPRPQFEAPTGELPVRSFQRKLTAQPMKRLADLWFAAPRYARRIAVLVPVGIVALLLASRLDLSGSTRDARNAVMSRISRRAAINIQDDFRSGLSQWTGDPGWANSWSYDGTGFARPGRMALLSGSLPLADYRLEFLGQIEKKAIGWVFRAADAHNYYATKLVETNHGPAAKYFIVRYAVIGGRERLRTQLPLPVTGPAKTMFRVREEVRGTQFTTYLDGRVVDTWSDPSLGRGGVGFFADPGETAYIRWVDVAYQDDRLGRLCSYLAPGKQN
jgi:hypothetical protein